MAAVKQFSAKQKTAMTWWANPRYQEYDAIICDGAVRSGKTLSMGMGFFLWAMRRFSGEQFALCGKTIVSLRRNVLHEILPKVTALGFHCEEKRSENLVIVRSGGRENRFYLFGGYDEGSAALIQGVTLAGVLFDEAALMPRSFVEQASARCSISGSKLWFNCNPEGPMHWFYREWILRAEERGALYLHFTMDDNPSLSPRIRARYEKAYSGTFYRRFILGEWTAAKGIIYDFFMPQEYCARVPEKPWERVRISIDYGTVNPTSFGLWALKDGVWYRAREYYFDSRREGRQKTDAEYVADLKKFAAGETVEKVIVDPSAASFIEALRREGFPVSKADNDVADGMANTVLPLSSDIYLEVDGKKVAVVQSYTTRATRTSREIEAFGENEPVATIAGANKYTLELSRLYATDEAISDGINFYDLNDFSLVICKPDKRIIYSQCRWSSIEEAGKLGDPAAEKVTIIARKRMEIAS